MPPVDEARRDGAVLTVSEVAVRFGGVSALSDISLSVQPGTVTGLIGPNGAGKTTLLGVLSGDVRCDAGTIALDGRDITKASASQRARLGIGRTYQVPRPFNGLTVFEHALYKALQGEIDVRNCEEFDGFERFEILPAERT